MIRKIFILVLLAGVVCPISGAEQQAVRYKNANGRRYVYLRDVATYYGMKCYVSKEQTTLYGHFKKLEFKHDSRFAVLNGVRVSLCYPPFRAGIQSFISELDLFTIYDPVLRQNALPDRRSKVILIDPGHGGKDQGGAGKVLLEKKLTLDIARELCERLKKLGFTALMTRTGDYQVPLDRRADLCRKYKADLFISVHGNVAASKSVAGIETFCLTPSGVGSTNGGKAAAGKESGNKYNQYNFVLAYQVQKALLRRTMAEDRGVKFARFLVLKNAPCPAILVETGFLSNSKEEKSLATEWRQKQTAQAIIDGIIAYSKMMK